MKLRLLALDALFLSMDLESGASDDADASLLQQVANYGPYVVEPDRHALCIREQWSNWALVIGL